MSSSITTVEERRRLSTWRLRSHSPRSSITITTSTTNQEETLGSPKTELRKRARGSLDMEVRTFLLAAIAFLGFLSGLLGFIAEGKKIVESKVIRLSATECVHSRSPALFLGLVAAIALLIAQIISNSLGGCICCESGPNDPSRKKTPTVLAISFLTLSWITFSIAFLLLIAGASINDTRDASDNLSTGCFVLKSGVFTGAAFASFATAILGIAYNVQVFSIRKNMDSTCISNIGPSSSEGANSSNTQGALNSQGYSIGKPIFSTEQHMKRIPSSKTKVQEPAYGRNAVSNNKDFRSLQMVNITTSAGKPGQQARGKNNLQDSREPQIGTKKPTMSPQNYKNPQHYTADQGENNYYSQNAMQSALAAYMPVVAKANTPMNTRDAHIEQQQASQPAFTRQGVCKNLDTMKEPLDLKMRTHP